MKITTNYSMHNTRMQKCCKPSFQAFVTPVLKEALILEAKKTTKMSNLIEQFKNIGLWGSPKSCLIKEFDTKTQKEGIVLVNHHLSSSGEPLKVALNDNGLLNKFLSLKETDIINAEKAIKNKTVI